MKLSDCDGEQALNERADARIVTYTVCKDCDV